MGFGGIPIIGGIIDGITGIIGAKGKADAAKRASRLQQQEANRISELNRGVYQQQMSGMEPYAALGRQGANTLGRLMTPGVAYSREMQLADAQKQYNAPPPWAMTPGGQLTMNSPGQHPEQAAPLGQLASQTVQLRAPNGSVRAVPANMVEQMLAKGAVRV